MESNKYYTPEIEEIFNSPDLIYSENVNINPYTYRDEIKYIDLKKDFDLNIVKVKYLDQEDIESLGWEWKKDRASYPTMFLGYWMLKPDGDMYELKSNSYLHYYGPIKNKSELKKLMKQLNIHDIK